MEKLKQGEKLSFAAEEVLVDYRLAYKSRQASLIGRREVLSGKAKFGIFGDGKEVPQLAMAKTFQPGDFRSGYYRDQTFMFSTGEYSISTFFAHLYADPDLKREPASGGRSMNAHFSTQSLNEDGTWKDITKIKNSSSDVSPTGAQMPRLVGLAYASRLYRELEGLKELTQFSHNGNEVAFGTIGNASAAEGMFWESLNAIAVLRSPAVVSVWDDDYGISVPNSIQHGRDLADQLLGFAQTADDARGFHYVQVPGWDYPALMQVYQEVVEQARKEHIPAIVHVVELTQPQGHSTSGSHERYKTEERLAWEKEHDCITRFRRWIVAEGYATDEELTAFEEADLNEVEEIRAKAWDDYKEPIIAEVSELVVLMDKAIGQMGQRQELTKLRDNLATNSNPVRMHLVETSSKFLAATFSNDYQAKAEIAAFKQRIEEENEERYGSHLYSETDKNAKKIAEVKAIYSENSPLINGFEVLNRAFDEMLARDERVVAFGEDLGKIGGVNQAFARLQEKYGELRVSDTGIRETTIIGQAIGLAMRGLRPIAEIQYLDYILYALQTMSDDLATVHWRTRGFQKAPVIIRTRGHRLEGIWHAGSPMAGIIHLVRGMHVAVPRNMVQAAGMYNTLLESDDPGLVVEVLNGYRLKERLPDNIAEMRVPLGAPEVLREGSDVTIVTYGALSRISLEAAERLDQVGISAEVIDVQTLLPFDINHTIVESLKKTNRILFLDEDVPGGTTAYMLQEVIEKQGGYYWLDAEPRTLSAKPHRPPFGTDGGYFAKPNTEAVFDTVYDLMHEADPARFPSLSR
jgi:pyruvate/2-oxoglutarate/acetoin dehydrogenase E1 component/TPP-dependent pyruvate/acetoin dehydrogenase alpha subunit